MEVDLVFSQVLPDRFLLVTQHLQYGSFRFYQVIDMLLFNVEAVF